MGDITIQDEEHKAGGNGIECGGKAIDGAGSFLGWMKVSGVVHLNGVWMAVGDADGDIGSAAWIPFAAAEQLGLWLVKMADESKHNQKRADA